jgi:hypothetical protein
MYINGFLLRKYNRCLRDAWSSILSHGWSPSQSQGKCWTMAVNDDFYRVLKVTCAATSSSSNPANGLTLCHLLHFLWLCCICPFHSSHDFKNLGHRSSIHNTSYHNHNTLATQFFYVQIRIDTVYLLILRDTTSTSILRYWQI